MAAWTKFRRTDGQAADSRSLVTLRRAALAFNAHFVRANKLQDATRITVHCDPSRYRLGLSFHSDLRDQDSFAVTADGGQSGGDGRAVQISAIMRQHRWLKAAASTKNTNARRYAPVWNAVEKFWVVSIRPSFESKASSADGIAQDVCGIYRYWASGQVVYIGRGAIRARVKSPERSAWVIDAIEFSAIADESEQEKWEAVWIDEYRNEYGVLPFFNRIGGAVQYK